MRLDFNDSTWKSGKAELGDKTMLDSYLPGLDVLEAADAADPQAALTGDHQKGRNRFVSTPSHTKL